VQNAIDAGSPSIEIRIEHETAEQKLRVTVRDRGEGMSQDTIENQLTRSCRWPRDPRMTSWMRWSV
jgi:molecular chaperone HtpG